MASGKTLNAANLQALGAARLAELLLEIAADDAAAKRRLRLALAAGAGSGDAAREVGKRLTTLAKARGLIEGPKVKALADEVEGLRRAIGELVAPADPREAFDLMWRLAGCADAVLKRSDDRGGRLEAIFAGAVQDLGPLAQAAVLDPLDLAARAFEPLRNDSAGVFGDLVHVLAPQLREPGLSALKGRMAAWQAEPVVTPPQHERRVVGWGGGGAIYADRIDATQRRRVTQRVLQRIADAQGDVDGYIAQVSDQARASPVIAAEIARRLLKAGRPQEASEALDAVGSGDRNWMPAEWDAARLETLDALGRAEAAQSLRWQRFVQKLEASYLRDYMRKLPDFEDFEAEQRGLTHALTFRDVHQALVFLVGWPDLQRANELVLSRTKELNGDLYEVLSPAADALQEKYPLAATLLRRAMIGFTLDEARASRYKHAARHLYECASHAGRIADFGTAPDHATYAKALHAEHWRKIGFWEQVKAFS
jgi:hypothetical protein